MTALDIIVLLVVGTAAIGGAMRGFVQEVLSLLAWVVAILVIRYFHTDVSLWLAGPIGSPSGAAVLAFVVLLAVPYALMRVFARWAGQASRTSVLGPLDRLLGVGFGTVKGGIIVVVAFSLLVLGYDTVWGEAGRPDWVRDARTYQFLNAGSTALVELIEDHRRAWRLEAAASSS